jgi:hypothetical protein
LISFFAQPCDLCHNPLAIFEHKDTDCAHLCSIKPFRSKLLLRVVECEAALCEFIAENLLGLTSEAAFGRELEEFFVAQSPIAFVERFFCLAH